MHAFDPDSGGVFARRSSCSRHASGSRQLAARVQQPSAAGSSVRTTRTPRPNTAANQSCRRTAPSVVPVVERGSVVHRHDGPDPGSESGRSHAGAALAGKARCFAAQAACRGHLRNRAPAQMDGQSVRRRRSGDSHPGGATSIGSGHEHSPAIPRPDRSSHSTGRGDRRIAANGATDCQN